MSGSYLERLFGWLVIALLWNAIAVLVFHAPEWAGFLGGATIAYLVVPSKAA